MEKFHKWGMCLAKASGGNPVLSTATVMLFYVMFNIFMATIEKLIFGYRFENWLDPVFACAFIAYSAYAVYCCALFNGKNNQD